MLWYELEFRLNEYCKKGGKISRRKYIRVLDYFWILQEFEGVKGPDQIGKQHAHEWYNSEQLAIRTLTDHYYAIKLLWKFLKRKGTPPYPKTLEEADLQTLFDKYQKEYILLSKDYKD